MQNELLKNSVLTISSLKRRILALFIDTAILGVVGAVLGYSLIGIFGSIGSLGRLIGFVIAFSYFTILNSFIGKGQSIGKRILKIKIIQINGKYLSIKKSALRSSVILIPYFLNGAAIDPNKMNMALNALLSMLVFGFGFSIIYLIIATKNTRQGLHDVIAGTVVVYNDANEIYITPTINKVHYVIVCLIILTSVVVPFFTKNISNNELGSLNYLYEKICIVSGSSGVSISDNTNYRNGSKTSNTLKISVKVDFPPKIGDSVSDSYANNIAKVVFDEYLQDKERDNVNIVLVYGFDIGIYSSNRRQNFNFTPVQWKERMNMLPNKR